jgi:hypothetical protein
MIAQELTVNIQSLIYRNLTDIRPIAVNLFCSLEADPPPCGDGRGRSAKPMNRREFSSQLSAGIPRGWARDLPRPPCSHSGHFRGPTPDARKG